MARGVEEVDAVARVIELEHGRGHRDAALFFEFHPVGGRRALLAPGGDAAGELHRAAVEEEFFGQRGLARVRVADDGERAPAGDFGGKVRGHGSESGHFTREPKFCPACEYARDDAVRGCLRAAAHLAWAVQPRHAARDWSTAPSGVDSCNILLSAGTSLAPVLSWLPLSPLIPWLWRGLAWIRWWKSVPPS